MLQSCTKKYTDNSDETMFRFIFYCDCCGAPYECPPIPFSEGRPEGPPTDTAIELWKLRWKKEHDQAFARANAEAARKFFGCPGCGKYICQNCVVSTPLPTGEILDRCLDCTVKSEGFRPFRMVNLPTKEVDEGKEDVHGVWRKITARINKAFH